MNRLIYILLTSVIFLLLPSCGDDTPKPAKEKSRTVLIYAVASNNLDSYLQKDIDEMIAVAPEMSGLGSSSRVLLYSVRSKSADEATLAELLPTPSGEWEFQDIKSYSRNTFSTDPARMREVYSDVRSFAPSDTYGLVMWSHGTGWFPDFSSHETSRMQRSFGWDTYQGVTDKCDIEELADAVPDRMFDYIWFDACYMMGIEVVYQLRDKCDFIAGYPTEDWSPGMNYETTLPMLAAYDADLEGAAKAFFDYYNNANMAVTVSLIATTGLDRLADAAAAAYAAGARPEDASGLQDYGRSPYRGLYDFGQFTRAYAGNSHDIISTFDDALDDILVFGGCSTKDFNGKEGAFDPEQYSGLSCHFPDTSDAEKEEYFRTLDWVKATNP